MKKTTTALLSAALLLLLAFPALAAHTYVGTAAARGLELSLAGEVLEVGFSEAAVQSAASDDGCGRDRGLACASAAGLVTPGETAQAHAPGSPGPDEAPALDLPDTVSALLTGEVAGARAEARSGEETGTARAGAGGVGLALTATPELAEASALQEALAAMAAALPAADPDDSPDEVLEALRTTLDQLALDASAAPLVSLSGGSSSALANDIGGVTTATATTAGAVLVVAPTVRSTPEVPEGLIILQAGEGTATATTDQRRGAAEHETAAVTLSVYDPQTRTYDVQEILVGGSACAAGGTPLETCVAVGDGEDTVEGAGAAAAIPGVTIDALRAPLPALQLAVGGATAAVAAAPPRTQPTTPVPSRRLPATGGDPAIPGGEVLLPALGMLILGGGVWLGRRRRA